MKHSLMLIESPNKINTITRYLSGKNIKVYATIGHIRELDNKSYKGLGFKEDTYETKWVSDSTRKFKGKTFDVIDEIKKEAKKANEIYLSTDPDREGEAIAWHIYCILDPENQKKCKRIVFNEITKDAINKAFQNPRDLDENQINSYLARKLLDRGLGFKLSDFTRRSIGGDSAGRVQSIALKFIKDRYDEILAFIPEHWFNIFIKLENGLELTLKELSKTVNAKLKDNKSSTVDFVNEKEAKSFLETLDDYFTLVEIEKPKKERKSPPKPFKTSSMQSNAVSRLGMSVSQVVSIAQKLYEGVEIDGESIALITYPRTDREDLSDSFINEGKKWLLNEFGDKYVATYKRTPKKKENKELLVQGAHEAIRPTDVNITPSSLEGKLDSKHLRLYKLIWLNAVASLMKDALFSNTLYKFNNNDNIFTANHRIETFDGFLALFRKFKKENEEELIEDDNFPALNKGEKYKSKVKEVIRVDKKPPSLYTESSLIKALEDKGIGRPSTYAHIVGIVLKRNYAVKEQGKFVITPLGIQISNTLQEYFPKIMKYDYTRNMEESLDGISENKLNWKEFLDTVFKPFNGDLSKALECIKSVVVGVCPVCNGELKNKYSIRTKRKFVGCDKFPTCKYIQPDENQENEEVDEIEKINEKCPDCGGDLVQRMSKWKKAFLGCSNYPTCTYIKRDTPTQQAEDIGRECPECKGKLIKKLNKWNRPFISCQEYPKCKYIESLDEKEETGEKCPKCSQPLWKVIGRFNKPYIKCSSSECKYRKSSKNKQDN